MLLPYSFNNSGAFQVEEATLRYRMLSQHDFSEACNRIVFDDNAGTQDHHNFEITNDMANNEGLTPSAFRHPETLGPTWYTVLKNEQLKRSGAERFQVGVTIDSAVVESNMVLTRLFVVLSAISADLTIEQRGPSEQKPPGQAVFFKKKPVPLSCSSACPRTLKAAFKRSCEFCEGMPARPPCPARRPARSTPTSSICTSWRSSTRRRG